MSATFYEFKVYIYIYIEEVFSGEEFDYERQNEKLSRMHDVIYSFDISETTVTIIRIICYPEKKTQKRKPYIYTA